MIATSTLCYNCIIPSGEREKSRRNRKFQQTWKTKTFNLLIQINCSNISIVRELRTVSLRMCNYITKNNLLELRKLCFIPFRDRQWTNPFHVTYDILLEKKRYNFQSGHILWHTDSIRLRVHCLKCAQPGYVRRKLQKIRYITIILENTICRKFYVHK